MKLMKCLSATTLMIACAFILPACAVQPASPPDLGSLAMKILPAGEVHIVQTSARQEGANVVVEGKVSRKKIGGRGIVKGHVDIEILDKEGKTLREVTAGCSPGIIPKLSGTNSSFSAQIPLIAPEESLIKLYFHNGPHRS